MTIKAIVSILHRRHLVARSAAVLGLTSLAICGTASASVPSITPSSVIPGDTYNIEVVGYNNSDLGAEINLITPTLAPTFNTQQTYANGALAGQTLTVSSFETTDAGVTTDTIILNVPTNFVPTGTRDKDGNIINSVEFSIGNYLGGTNTLDFNTPLFAPVVTGAVTINSPVMTGIGLVQEPIYSNGNLSFSDLESATSANTADISANVITSFSVSLSYGAVPEPSTSAAMLLGAAGLCWLTIVRRRRRA